MTEHAFFGSLTEARLHPWFGCWYCILLMYYMATCPPQNDPSYLPLWDFVKCRLPGIVVDLAYGTPTVLMLSWITLRRVVGLYYRPSCGTEAAGAHVIHPQWIKGWVLFLGGIEVPVHSTYGLIVEMLLVNFLPTCRALLKFRLLQWWWHMSTQQRSLDVVWINHWNGGMILITMKTTSLTAMKW